MEVYLRWPKVEAAARLVGNCLLGADMGENSAVVRSIEAFWDNPTGGADPNEVLESLRKVKPDEPRPRWEQQMARWTRRFGQARKVEEPTRAGVKAADKSGKFAVKAAGGRGHKKICKFFYFLCLQSNPHFCKLPCSH